MVDRQLGVDAGMAETEQGASPVRRAYQAIRARTGDVSLRRVSATIRAALNCRSTI
jgi:hypothetical protein